jgi:predicted secreted protein
VPVRRLRCQDLICWPFAFLAWAHGREEIHEESLPTASQATPERIAEEVEDGVLRFPAPVRVLAVHDLRLVRVQLQAQGRSRSAIAARKCRACSSVLQWATMSSA